MDYEPGKREIQEDDQQTKKIIQFPPPSSQEASPGPPPSFTELRAPIVFTAPLPNLQEPAPPSRELRGHPSHQPRGREPGDFAPGEEREGEEREGGEREGTAQLSEEIQVDTGDLPPAIPFMNTLLRIKLPPTEEGNIIQLPKEDGKFTAILKDLGEKADHYADNMFQDSGQEHDQEVTRLERLIPGTDREEGSRVLPQAKKRARPLPQDVSPRALQQGYGKALKALTWRRRLLFVLLLASAFLTLNPGQMAELIPWLALPGNTSLTLGLGLILGLILSWPLLFEILGRAPKFGMDSLALVSALVCLGDCYFLMMAPEASHRLPYVSLVLLTLTLGLQGLSYKTQAHLLYCRVAAKIKRPYLLFLEPGKWNAKPTYSTCAQEPTGFTSQLQMEDLGERVYALVCPLLLLGALAISFTSSTSVERFFWSFSAILSASVPCAFGLVYSRGALKVAKRLSKQRCALAGWPGVEQAGRQCVLTDTDLFPVGSIALSGTRIFEGFQEKRVIAYTSALILEGELGISRIFADMLGKKALTPPEVKEVSYHEGGGISGKIGQDVVLVGCATFMELMDVAVPEGLYLPHAVFSAINGKLAGIFALDYQLPLGVSVSLDSLLTERIRPVLSTRDFGLEPKVLSQRFHLKTGRMDFPSITRRRELSQDSRPEQGNFVGILCREGLESLSDTVISAKRLRKSTRWAVGIVVLASLLGFGLTGYLVSKGAFSALATDNLLIFMALWLAPVWVVTDLPQRF